jgi:hypothetical protein
MKTVATTVERPIRIMIQGEMPNPVGIVPINKAIEATVIA